MGMLSPTQVWIGSDSMDYLTVNDLGDHLKYVEYLSLPAYFFSYHLFIFLNRGLIVTSAPRDASSPARTEFFNALSNYMYE